MTALEAELARRGYVLRGVVWRGERGQASLSSHQGCSPIALVVVADAPHGGHTPAGRRRDNERRREHRRRARIAAHLRGEITA